MTDAVVSERAGEVAIVLSVARGATVSARVVGTATPVPLQLGG